MYLRIDFPSGQYVAALSSDPSYPEWPPHPSRIFSAFVASAYQSRSGMTAHKRNALKWFETLPAPEIAAPEANLSQAPTAYVPPGDLKGRKGKTGEVIFEHGVHRWRQARYFPRANILGKPSLFYSWEKEPEQIILSALIEIAQGITHIGTSHSMASVLPGTGNMPLPPCYVPDQNGKIFIRVPVSGRLDELDDVYQQKFRIRRPPSYCETNAAYRKTVESARIIHPSGFDFFVLRISDTMHGADTAACLGRALRRAVMSVMGDDAPPEVHGHNTGLHVGWLPLPDVGHPYAKGRIIGIGVAVPKNVATDIRLKVLATVGQIKTLRLSDGWTAKLEIPPPGEKLPIALRSQTWIESSTRWSTVTPVVLDRPPKRLVEKRIKKAVVQSLNFAGYPEPVEIKLSAFSRFHGSPPAFRIQASKPRFHASLQFGIPVAGPLIAGSLRYFGIGLFRPLSNGI